MWEKLAYFAGGLIIGGAAGYFVTKELIEDKANDRAKKQAKELKEYYEAQLAATRKAAELNEMKQKHAETMLQIEQEKALKNALIDYAAESQKASAKKANADDEDEWGDARRPKGAPKKVVPMSLLAERPPEYEEEDGVKIYPTEPSSEPVIITEQAFADEHYEFEKQTLFWFTQDNVVTDEEYQPLEDLSLIGNEWETAFGTEDDPDVVHVRNQKIGCDYEIIRDKRAYATTLPE